MNRTLETIIAELQHAQSRANVNLDLISPQMRPSHQLKARQSRDNAALLTLEYKGNLLRNGVAFAVSGTPEQERAFTDIAVSKGLLVYDCNELTKKVGLRASLTMGRKREFGINQLSAVVTDLQEVADVNDIPYLATLPKITDATVLKDDAAVAAHVRNLLDTAFANFSQAYAAHSLTTTAIGIGYKAKVLAAVLLGSNSYSVNALSTYFRAIVNVAIEPETVVDEAYVVSVLEQKSKKKPGPKPKTQTEPETTTEPKETGV